MIIKNHSLNNGWVDIQDLGVYLNSKVVPESPKIEMYESGTISGRKLLMGYDYTHRELEAKLFIKRKDESIFREKLNELNRLLSGELSVIFKSSPNMMYRKVFLNSSVDVEEVTTTAFILSLKMTAYDPFRYHKDLSVESFTNVSSSRSHNIVNLGNYSVKPIIKITGRASEINITTNGQTVSYVNLVAGETLYIDNETYSIYKIVNGQKVNALSRWRDNFIELKPGDNSIYFSGVNMNLEIEFSFNAAYL